jgi:hypothetical protein
VKDFVVRLELRVRLSDGSRPYLDPVLSANGKVKPLYAVVDGKAEHHHPEGTYFDRVPRLQLSMSWCSRVAAIRPDSQSVKLAEIMCIQFKQVSQDWGVFAQGGVKLNTSGRFICVFNHSESCCDRPHAGSRSSVEVGFVVYCSLAYSDLA